jgi:hypothetical protein
VAIFLAAVMSGCSGGAVTTGQATKRTVAARDDQLESARQVLAGSPERPGCATALQQLNGYFTAHPERRPAALSAEQKELLQKRFVLDAGELAEADSTSFTLLDAPHLEFCFLLRDVARSLDVDKLSPPEQAAAAFAWVMRQVLLQDVEGNYPPEFVLRRGWGSGLERAYVLLALLRQLDIPGCLITSAGQPWACGALVEVEGDKQRQVLVFDHRLGLPLPGPKGQPGGALARAYRLATPVPGPDDGQQVATLAALRAQPELLKPLATDPKAWPPTRWEPYDVGPEQVKEAVVRLALPVSALSPRMAALQDDLLPRQAGLRPAADATKWVAQFGAAAGVEAGGDGVRAREGAAGVLRRFLTDREGGIDKEDVQQRARVALIPRNVLPRQVVELGGEPGQEILARFAAPFILIQMEPGSPRDRVLRGQFKEASEQLSTLREQFRVQKDLLRNNPDVLAEFDRWKDALFKAFGDVSKAQEAARKGTGSQEAVDQSEAQRDQVRKAGARILNVLVDGSAAEPRLAQSTFQLALCMHEQAERAQARADQLARANPPADAEELAAAREAARGAWGDAASWWDSYVQSYPGTPFAAHAQLLHARGRDALGNRDRARALLEEGSAGVGPFPTRARLVMAQRLKGP